MTRAIGTDVVEVARLRGYLARVGRLGERLFTPAERQDCAGRTESLAARLAAKEAVLKALGSALEACGAPPPTGWRYRDVEVVAGRGSPPRLRLHGPLQEAARDVGVRTWHLSLAHDAGIALAFVVAE